VSLKEDILPGIEMENPAPVTGPEMPLGAGPETEQIDSEIDLSLETTPESQETSHLVEIGKDLIQEDETHSLGNETHLSQSLLTECLDTSRRTEEGPE
jgi:hypothetical protein